MHIGRLIIHGHTIYATNPARRLIIGSPGIPKRFVMRMDCHDCGIGLLGVLPVTLACVPPFSRFSNAGRGLWDLYARSIEHKPKATVASFPRWHWKPHSSPDALKRRPYNQAVRRFSFRRVCCMRRMASVASGTATRQDRKRVVILAHE